MHISSQPYVLQALPISVFLIWWPNDIWWVTQSTKLLVRVVHSTPPLPRTSWTRKQKQF
jgi:hypothetical protein